MIPYIIHKLRSITIQVRLKVRFFFSKVLMAVVERHLTHCRIKNPIFIKFVNQVTRDIKQVVIDNDWGLNISVYKCRGI